MAEFRVTSSALRSKKEELEQRNKQLEAIKKQYEASEKTLNSSWEGEAKKAFQKAFEANMQLTQSLITTITVFLTRLESIIAEYEATEAKNAALAGGK